MDAFNDFLHRLDAHAEFGHSQIHDINCDAYKLALKQHMAAKFKQLFRARDNAGDRSYNDTQFHSELDAELARMRESDTSCKYVWFTVNTANVLPTFDEVIEFQLACMEVSTETGYFGGKVFARLELFTPGGNHLHCHLLAQLGMDRSPTDVKKHLINQKTADKFRIRKEGIHVGDSASKYVYKYDDKIEYLNGNKVTEKGHCVAADKQFFNDMGIEQFWQLPAMEDDEAGADGLVVPAYPAALPIPRFAFEDEDFQNIPETALNSDAPASPIFGSTEPFEV